MKYRGVEIKKYQRPPGSRHRFMYGAYIVDGGVVRGFETGNTLVELKRRIDRHKDSRENPLRSGQYALIGLGVVTVGLVAYGLWSKFGIQALASANQAAFASSSSGNSPTELAAYQGYASTVAPSTASPLVSPLPVVPE
jgi:hypothetical protein